MKKLVLLSAIATIAVAVLASSYPNTLVDFTASGGASSNVTANALTAASFVVDSILATSDLAGSVITIQKGNAAGSTNNYTTVAQIGVGAATLNLNGYGNPIFVGVPGYQYAFILNCTTSNSLIVNGYYR